MAYGLWLTATHEREAIAKSCIATAIDAGVTFFDAADVYEAGFAEELLGHVLRHHERDAFVVATKVFGRMGPRDEDRGLSRAHIRESCDASLRRLGTDYIDLYQMHGYDRATPLVETLTTFGELLAAGKIRYAGVCNWSAQQLKEARELAVREGLPSICANQVQTSLLWREHRRTEEAARGLGMGQIAWSPLAQGVLSGKYERVSSLPPGTRATTAGPSEMRYLARFLQPKVLRDVKALAPIANDLGISSAQLAVAWALAQPTIASAIVGGSEKVQILEIAAAAELVLPAGIVSALESTLPDLWRCRADG